MESRLAGQVVVVFGGARGIGQAIAEAFAREKAQVAIVDREPTVTDTATAIQTAASVPTLGLQADVTDYAGIESSVATILSEWSQVQHVVFAVGIGSGKFGFPFWNVPPQDWLRVLNINVVGAANVAQAVYQPLIDSGAGSMIFLGSVAGQIGSQTDPPYSASKAALINFAQCAAKDLARYNVRVNTINPGMVKTALNQAVWQGWADQQPEESRQSYDEWAADKISKVVPLNRWQEATDIANMVVFLASPLAKNITGQTINVDGGFVMHW